MKTIYRLNHYTHQVNQCPDNNSIYCDCVIQAADCTPDYTEEFYSRDLAMNTLKWKRCKAYKEYGFIRSFWQLDCWDVEELTIDEDGEIVEDFGAWPADEEPAGVKIWYAVLSDKYPDDWSDGSRDLEAAHDIAKAAQAEGETGVYIAVIDDENNYCLEEIRDI